MKPDHETAKARSGSVQPVGSASTDKICIMCGKPFTPTFTESVRIGTTIACAKCQRSFQPVISTR